MTTVTDSPKGVRPLRIGGGGFIRGHDQHTDGTHVCRTDVYGAYIWNAATLEWEQLFTTARMPAGDAHVDLSQGCYEIMIAPSNSSIIYMVQTGWVYKSTDRGASFTKTNFTRDADLIAGDQYNASFGPKMAIDPLDPNVVYLGTQKAGLWYTRDGGTNWTQIETGTIPFGTVDANGSYPGVNGVIINPYSAAISGRTSEVWAASHANGYYRSTDGGDTWSKPSSGPASSVSRASFAIDGQLYCTPYSHTGTVAYKWSGTAWSTFTVGTGCQDIICSPTDAAHIIAVYDAGDLNQSLNRGTTFTGKMATFTQDDAGTGDIPWFNYAATTAGGTFMVPSHCSFHPTIADKIIMSAGLGVFTLSGLSKNAASSYHPNWVSQSKGIEELVANGITWTSNDDLILWGWDKPIWKITYPDAFPTSFFFPPSSATKAINHCWHMDYASSDPNFLVALISDQTFTENYSSYSSDGGDTWTRFAADPTGSAYLGDGAGAVAVSTASNWVIVPDTNGQSDPGPQYTTDGGATWNTCTFSDAMAQWFGSHLAYYLNHYCVAADRVLANTFYYIHGAYGKVYRSTDSGANFTLVKDFAASYYYHCKFKSVPGKSGHLWFTPGVASGSFGDWGSPSGSFVRSQDGGVTWTTISNVLEVYDFCFGATAPGATYPTIYLNGWVNGTYGVYYSTDECANFTKISEFPLGLLDHLQCMDAHKTQFGKLIVGFSGSGWAYFDGAAEGYKRFRLNAS